MAPTRKPQRRTVPAKTGANHQSAKPRSVNETFLGAIPALPTTLHPEPPGFLIIGIGAADGGLEAMEEVTAQRGGGSAPLSGTRNLTLGHSRQGRRDG